jgi:arylsulfatase A-like enzyme
LEQKLPLDGRDIRPVLAEGKASPHEDILLNAITANDGAIRMGDWKLILPHHTETENPFPELYNLAKDPKEMNNLAPKESSRVETMSQQLDTWWKP